MAPSVEMPDMVVVMVITTAPDQFVGRSGRCCRLLRIRCLRTPSPEPVRKSFSPAGRVRGHTAGRLSLVCHVWAPLPSGKSPPPRFAAGGLTKSTREPPVGYRLEYIFMLQEGHGQSRRRFCNHFGPIALKQAWRWIRRFMTWAARSRHASYEPGSKTARLM